MLRPALSLLCVSLWATTAAAGPSDLAVQPDAPRGMSPVGGELAVPTPDPLYAVPTPIAKAYCQINVNGALKDTETDYIPHVIQCENGGANLEALKAQAIAARSVAYYNMATSGKICDGQGCQVYSCNATPKQIHLDAAKATAGQYLSFNKWLTYGFYVAGDSQQPASCIDTANGNVSATEKYVTFNEGKTVYNVDQTSLGFVFPEDLNTNGYGQNRGCMSQWGARCLENTKGYSATKILKFYYGDDIQIITAQGACVPEPPPPNKLPEGNFEAIDCASGLAGWAWDPDHADKPVNVYIAYGGKLDDPAATTFTVLADDPRDDLCQALGACEHAFTYPVPRSLRDGAAHPVHVYAVDLDKGGNVEIAGSPKDLVCAPPSLPDGVRRHIPSPDVLTAWNFSTFWQMAVVDPPTLAAIPEWKDIDPAPALIQVQGDPAVWLVDGAFRRLVPSPEVAAAWQFDLGAVQNVTADELLAMPEGTPVRPEPFLVKSDGPEVYVLDDPQCTPEGDPLDPQCPVPAEPGSTGEPGTGGGVTDSGGTGGGGGTGEATSGGMPDFTTGPADPPDTTGSTSPGPGSGPVFPPGFGQSEDGCACAAGDRNLARETGILALLGLLLRRRRRRS